MLQDRSHYVTEIKSQCDDTEVVLVRKKMVKLQRNKIKNLILQNKVVVQRD